MARTTKVRDNNGSAEVTVPKFIKEGAGLEPGVVLDWDLRQTKKGPLITARKIDESLGS